ncbi:protein-disulfide reductase DsbD domain-containing protein [Aminobacter sp. Piv2-1]|uniref:protein-disulfide reductase DsbD domain-containing protein n=1 Tax=Aminobacter sp. Piv2-1 TaxID=3031122 RepID=UPI003094C164
MLKTMIAMPTVLCQMAGVANAAPQVPLEASRAFVFEASRAGDGTALSWQVAEEYHFYRDRFRGHYGCP